MVSTQTARSTRNRTFKYRSEVAPMGTNPRRKSVVEKPGVAKDQDDYARVSREHVNKCSGATASINSIDVPNHNE
jgi:hypothetical protein